MKDNSLEILKNIEIAKKKHKEGNLYQANEIYKKLINQKIYTFDLLLSYGLFNKEINNLKIAKIYLFYLLRNILQELNLIYYLLKFLERRTISIML